MQCREIMGQFPRKAVYTYNGMFASLILTRATTWLNLEDTMLSEISQLQGDKPGTIPREVFRVAEITDSAAVTGGGRERRMRSCWLTGIERVLVLQEEKNSGDVCGAGGHGDCTSMWMYSISRLCTLKTGYDGQLYTVWISPLKKWGQGKG